MRDQINSWSLLLPSHPESDPGIHLIGSCKGNVTSLEGEALLNKFILFYSFKSHLSPQVESRLITEELKT